MAGKCSPGELQAAEAADPKAASDTPRGPRPAQEAASKQVAEPQAAGAEDPPAAGRQAEL